MNFPVYPFRLVLKELRRDAGLTVLGAAEATAYGNYERWESSATRVGAQHLRSIADAFDVKDERWLLLYAWLVDRLTPTPGKGTVDLAHVNLGRVIRDLPKDEVDLGDHKHLVVQPGRHLEVALLCLIARYRRRQRTLLAPARRSPLPERRPGESVLVTAYGDVAAGAMRLVARTMLTAGQAHQAGVGASERALLTNVAPLLVSPEAFDELAAAVDEPLAGDVRRFAELLRAFRTRLEALTGELTATPRGPFPSAGCSSNARHADMEEEALVASLLAMVEIDPTMVAELEAIRDRVMQRWECQARRDAAAALDRVALDDLFDTLDLVGDASAP